MKVTKTHINGLLIVEPDVFTDDRGYFFESYNHVKYIEAGFNADFVQDNESKSGYGVIRGLHYQLNPYAQSKLIRVIEGAVWDVAVDIRKGSPTFGEWFGLEISAENKKQFFIPKGFAHGFSVLSETAIFSYKCDQYYNKTSERGIAYNDSQLGIDWKIEPSKAIISGKDQNNPDIKNAEINFNF